MASQKLKDIFTNLGLDASKADDFVNALKSEGLSIGSNRRSNYSAAKEIKSLEAEIKAKSGIMGMLFGDMREQRREFNELRKDVEDAEKERDKAEKEYKKAQRDKKKGLVDESKVQEAQNELQEKQLNLVRAESRELNQQIRARNEIKRGLMDIFRTSKDFLGTWGKIDQSASKFSKSVGTSAAGMERMRKNAIKNVTEGKFGINYGVGSEKMLELQQKYINNVGRNIQFSKSDQESMAALNAVMGDNGAEFAEKLENFGLSYTDAATRAGKMFKDASKYGISFEKYSKNVLTNIKLAQNYKFKDGIKGLESMAKKATAMKLDMQQVANFADKVNTVEGAINTGAQLQVLGGPFARFADPMGMLNESLTNMEGLQDRFEKMISGMAYYDKAKGSIAISSFNQVRIKEAAKAMGMDPSQVLESAMAKGRANYIGQQISGKYDKDTTDFLKNVATVQNGKATVSYLDESGKKHDVDLRNQVLTNRELKLIKEQSQTQEEDIKTIAKTLRGWDDIMRGTEEQKKSLKASFIETLGIGKGVKSITDYFARSNFLVRSILAIEAAKGVVSVIGGIRGGGLRDLFGKGAKSVAKTSGRTGGFSGGFGNAFGLGTSLDIPKGAEIVTGDNGMKYFTTDGGKSFTRLKDGVKVYGNKGGKGAAAGIAKNLGKKSAKVLGRNSAKLAKAANPLAIGGLIAELGTDALVASGAAKKGGFMDYAGHIGGGTASGAATGAMIGSVVPVIGNVAGAAIGAVVGGVRGFFTANKNGLERQIVEKAGVEMQGSYGWGKTRKIKKALETGQISDKLRHKLEQKGDFELLDKIDSIKKQSVNTESMEASVDKATIIINGLEGNQTVRGANGGLLTGPSHARGGMPILGSNIEVEGGEFVVNKKSAAKNIGILSAINQMDGGGIIKPREMRRGGSIKVEPSSLGAAIALQGGNFGASHVGPQEININIGGTIKLEGANGKQADITDELLKDPQFIRNITRLIESQMGTNITGGKVINKGLY